jgi:hypothetical protein
VVERTTLAWLARYRRLSIRYERRADIHEAILHLGCSLVCLNYLSGGFCNALLFLAPSFEAPFLDDTASGGTPSALAPAAVSVL